MWQSGLFFPLKTTQTHFVWCMLQWALSWIGRVEGTPKDRAAVINLLVTEGQQLCFLFFSRMTSPSAAYCYPALGRGETACLPFSQPVSGGINPVSTATLIVKLACRLPPSNRSSHRYFLSWPVSISLTFIIYFRFPPSRLLPSLPLSFLLQALSSPHPSSSSFPFLLSPRLWWSYLFPTARPLWVKVGKTKSGVLTTS